MRQKIVRGRTGGDHQTLPQSDLENPPKTPIKVANIPSLDLHPGPL
jgi:hypothetical protein